MIFVTDEFSKLPEAVREASFSLAATQFPSRDSIAAAARYAGSVHDLVFQGDGIGGAHLITRACERLERHRLYAVAPLGSETAGVNTLIAEIANRHGPGRWWSTGKPVNYIGHWGGDKDDRIRCARIDGAIHVVLAAYYFWAPSEAPAKPYAPGEKMTDRHPESVIAKAVDDAIAAQQTAQRAAYIATRVGSIKVTADASLQPNEVRLVSGGSMPIATATGAPAPWIAEQYAAPAPIPPEVLAQRDAMVRGMFEGCGIPPSYMAAPRGGMAEASGVAVASVMKEPYAIREDLEAQRRVARAWNIKMPYETRVDGPPPDPLDVEYDGVDLATLLAEDRAFREDRRGVARRERTPAQRAAVCAHWSAELRAKVKASAERERNRVLVDIDSD